MRKQGNMENGTSYLEVEPGVKLRVVVDDFTDPWRKAETVVMVHGMGQHLDAWWAWVPYLARHFRVVRFDVRGFGKSTPISETVVWTLDRLLDDIEAVLGYVGVESAHFVGSQSGATMMMALAARRPHRVKSLVAASPMIVGTKEVPQWLHTIETEGIPAWARSTMAGRLGSKATREQSEYWAEHMQGKTPLSTLRSYLRWVPGVDIRPDLATIRQPMLVIVTDGGGLRSVDGTRAWQEKIPGSKLVTILGDGWHTGGAYPDECAAHARDFLLSLTSKAS